jgi:hypothetical protein
MFLSRRVIWLTTISWRSGDSKQQALARRSVRHRFIHTPPP